MERIPFKEEELEFTGNPFAPFHYPENPGKNYVEAMHHRAPAWLGFALDCPSFTPRCVPENIARALVLDGGPELEFDEAPDMFGIKWTFVPSVGGSMESQDNPRLDDMNDWREFVTMPDPASWDWDAQEEISRDYMQRFPNGVQLMIMTGYFERLISFMGFEDAAVAMIDEEQEDAILEFFDELTDLYIRYIDIACERFNIAGMEFHDDWGSQQNPFFAPDVARKLIAPFIKRLSDHMHGMGKYCAMHCCGAVFDMVPIMIESGVDSWAPQYPLNDFSKLYATYGKDIVLAVVPPVLDASATEEEVYEAAQAFVDEFIHRDAPVVKSLYSPMENHPLMDKAIYELSRKAYSA